MAKKDEKTTNEEEGPRGFAHMLQQIEDGELHDDLGTKLQALVAECGSFAERYEGVGKGTLTLVLSISAKPNGAVDVSGDVKTKLPTMKRAGSVFWRTKGNNLTLDNPRQQKLPLREAPTPTRETKDISNEAGPVRGV